MLRTQPHEGAAERVLRNHVGVVGPDPLGQQHIVEPELLAARLHRCGVDMRAAGVAVLMHAGGGSMKSQFKRADASGARYALVFGADELAQGQVTVKALRNADVAQRTLALSAIGQWAESLQSNA